MIYPTPLLPYHHSFSIPNFDLIVSFRQQHPRQLRVSSNSNIDRSRYIYHPQLMALSTPSSSLDHNHQDATLSLSHDILQTHILTRLDGPTLAALSCASSEFYALSTHDQLWQNLCKSIWPSIDHPLITTLISTFPSAHRSFFSDSYSRLRHTINDHHEFPAATTALISAVDVYYQGVPIFSEVEKTETLSECFLTSPFGVDIIQSKEFVPTWVHQAGEKDSWSKQLLENVTLSWILIDPKGKRAMNMSSKWPISVQRHWLTGEVLVKFATVMAGDRESSSSEYVECEMVVTCGGKEGEEVKVRDVSMRMEDMEGKPLRGKDGLVIVKEAMERGERRKLGKDWKDEHMEFLARKKERNNQRKGSSILGWIWNATGIAY